MEVNERPSGGYWRPEMLALAVVGSYIANLLLRLLSLSLSLSSLSKTTTGTNTPAEREDVFSFSCRQRHCQTELLSSCFLSVRSRGRSPLQLGRVRAAESRFAAAASARARSPFFPLSPLSSCMSCAVRKRGLKKRLFGRRKLRPSPTTTQLVRALPARVWLVPHCGALCVCGTALSLSLSLWWLLRCCCLRHTVFGADLATRKGRERVRALHKAEIRFIYRSTCLEKRVATRRIFCARRGKEVKT